MSVGGKTRNGKKKKQYGGGKFRPHQIDQQKKYSEHDQTKRNGFPCGDIKGSKAYDADRNADFGRTDTGWACM